MPLFRKKPVTIEAVQYTGPNFAEMEAFVGGDAEFRDGQLLIATREGAMRASPGDYIIKGVKGEFYPCKPDIFDATYAPSGGDGLDPTLDGLTDELAKLVNDEDLDDSKLGDAAGNLLPKLLDALWGAGYGSDEDDEETKPVENSAQEAMDGSPAHVTRTLGELAISGKFAGVDPLVVRAGVPVIEIKFQCGPIGEVGVNGCSIEDVIDVLADRLRGFQAGPFACPENAAATDALEAAKTCLLFRTAKRVAQGVEGTNRPHA